ncbi:MAG: hypothetical protein HY352_00125 [Candidatus Omnitrophica bacterium]|nr:hypothetical protein [Candidatus Omnitrophota bacterium]
MRQGGVLVVAMAIVLSGLFLGRSPVFAAEHGGKEHGGAATQEHGGTASKEHGGQAVQAEPSAEQIRHTITDYVQRIAQPTGAFPITDAVTGTTRQLELVRVHDRVGKTGSLYYSCTDMRDKQTGELLDLDFDVEAEDGQLDVVDVRIHKLEGRPRYTYDEHDNRVPLQPTAH